MTHFDEATAASSADAVTRSFSPRKRIRLTPVVPLAVLIGLVIVALAAPLLTPYDPLKQDLKAVLVPPAWLAEGSTEHLLGTDTLGRDVLTRIIYGTRTALLVVGFTLSIAVAVGAGVGLVAGFFGGSIDSVLMRGVDVLMAIPGILVALALAFVYGGSFRNVVLIIGFFTWPPIARMVRGEAMVLKHRDFVQYATAVGTPRRRIIATHLLPNLLPTLLVATTVEVGNVIAVEASLSFLGAGIPPPTPSWGGMIDDGQALIATGWWLALFPGLAIMISVLSLNALGDWLRDRINPITRQPGS